MDQITKSLLEDFKEKFSLSDVNESKCFEYFCNYLIISDHADAININDLILVTENDHAIGVDGIAILIDGKLVSHPTEIEDIVSNKSKFDLDFIFCQSKTTGGFNLSTISNLEYLVKDFFSENPLITNNIYIKNFRTIKDKLIRQYSSKLRERPSCRIYYCTTGKWKKDDNLTNRIESLKQELEKINLFKIITFDPVDADRLRILYNQTINHISVEFTFKDKATLPQIKNVEQAYIGVLDVCEFIKIIKTESGAINKKIFYDNVRDWQDENDVNIEIKSTIENLNTRDRFSLMNNGVTVIAKSLNVIGNTFRMENFQIVNGCQTSHVIYNYNHRENEVSGFFVPLRIITTKDEEIINSIIKATNRQSYVEESQFLVLSEFQKKLEDYLKSFETNRIFYERRSGQFNGESIEKSRVIDIKNLIRSLYSCFLKEPHSAIRSFRSLVEKSKKDLFKDDHKLLPYYCASLSLYKLDYFFRNSKIDAKYKSCRYQMLMLFIGLLTGKSEFNFSSNEIEKKCHLVVEILNDTDESLKKFKQCIAILDKITSGNFDRDNIHSAGFTDQLKIKIEEDYEDSLV